MITIEKHYPDLPFAHRQPKHEGHCSLIHGHNWSFTFKFAADELDANGFVVDFGKLKWLREWLEDRFDHTLVLNLDDPFRSYLEQSLMYLPDTSERPFAKIVTVPNCGAEGLAEYIFEKVHFLLQAYYGTRVYLVSVTVFEDSKNSSTYAQ
jgi:6-pyruvoyltetrahydropterin/6-carboxytetrahydropterin synthase